MEEYAGLGDRNRDRLYAKSKAIPFCLIFSQPEDMCASRYYSPA